MDTAVRVAVAGGDPVRVTVAAAVPLLVTAGVRVTDAAPVLLAVPVLVMVVAGVPDLLRVGDGVPVLLTVAAADPLRDWVGVDVAVLVPDDETLACAELDDTGVTVFTPLGVGVAAAGEGMGEMCVWV